MGMTAFYGEFDRRATEEESLRTIGKALELGINFLDTAWIYQSFGMGGGGNFTNEELVGKALQLYGREKFVVATKFGIAFENGTRIISNSEATIRSQLNDSLSRLGTDYIDLYYMHRLDISIPIEDTMRTLKSLVEEGKIRYIGLSEVSASELRRAHAIYPVSAIQMEWSLQTRDIEQEIVPTARELGVGIVAYSPLGRGFLADVAAFSQLDEKDGRRSMPRYSGENFDENKRRVAKFFEMAQARGCTPAQLALAWLHAKGEDVFPIPGTKSSSRIVENAKAYSLLPLDAATLSEIEDSVAPFLGDRYSTEGMKSTYLNRL
jgi:aryl-alcohol dehydrogenase-like predicted oxidoreductase